MRAFDLADQSFLMTGTKPGSQTFDVVSIDFLADFVVPKHVNVVNARLLGASGNNGDLSGIGGRGAELILKIRATPGDTWKVHAGLVGEGGGPGAIGPGAGIGGAGSGASYILIGGTSITANAVAIAGGGGGASGNTHGQAGGVSLHDQSTAINFHGTTGTTATFLNRSGGGGGDGWVRGTGGAVNVGGVGGSSGANTSVCFDIVNTAAFQLGQGSVILSWA